MRFTLKTLFGFFIRCSSNERLRPRGEGGTMIFSYIRRLGPFFFLGGGVQNFEFQYIFGGFRKMIIFGGYEEYFLGVLEIPDIFWRGERYMRDPAYV